ASTASGAIAVGHRRALLLSAPWALWGSRGRTAFRPGDRPRGWQDLRESHANLCPLLDLSNRDRCGLDQVSARIHALYYSSRRRGKPKRLPAGRARPPAPREGPQRSAVALVVCCPLIGWLALDLHR